MTHKLSKRMLSILLAMVMLVGLLPTAALPTSAAELIGRDTISSVAITVGRPIVGEPLANCVPTTTLCDITCTWAVRGLTGTTEVPASTIAEAGKTYYLAMVLTPKLDLYTFDTSVTGTVNGNTVTVERVSSTKIACMVSLKPLTRETEVSVSVPQPIYGAIPGTPTVTGGHTVSDCTWWKSTESATSPETQLGENEAFSHGYDYYLEATVTAASASLFDESTAVTVNGKTAEILEQSTNTIRFRYHVDSSEVIYGTGIIFVADGNGGYWQLGYGDTKTNGSGYTASYDQSGVLTLTNTGDSVIGGTCKIPDESGYTGIYAGSDLTVRFEGDFHFDLSGTPNTAAYVYGIYVDGDLTIINGSAADCTVSFSPAEGILASRGSDGIYCYGDLTVLNESNNDFVLNADAVGVRPVNGAVNANFTNNGINTPGFITIGDNCTVNATATNVELSAGGTTISRGIYAYLGLSIGENAAVTATGGNINPSESAETLDMGNYQYCYGVQTETGNITVNGGTLTATGGNIDYGTLTGTGNFGTALGQDSYGIYGANITLNDGAITAKAGYSRSSTYASSSLSRGVFCGNMTVSGGTLTATADDAWLESIGIRVQNSLNQTGGTVNGKGGVAVCIAGAGIGSKGIYVQNVLTASGGSLTGTGGTMGNELSSVGLQAGTISLSGTAQVTGIGGLVTTANIDTPVTVASSFASYPGDSIGVWISKSLSVDGSAVLTATGGTVKGTYEKAGQAMSVGLQVRSADGVTISGNGTVVASGGESDYGNKGNSTSDSSCGIHGKVPSLTIDGTTVIATGGDVCTEETSSDYYTGGVSYGIHLPGASLILQNDAKLTATGGENPNYSTDSSRPSYVNDSYGAYIKGDITVTDSVLTATGGLSTKTVGLYNGGTVTLNGMSSCLTASADDYHQDAYYYNGSPYSYGAMNGDDSNPGGAYTVNGGILLLQGQTGAMGYKTDNTMTAGTIMAGSSRDGSDATSMSGYADFSTLAGSKYVKADGNAVYVTIKDWTYGDAASTPTYTDYEGEPTFLWTGTTRAGVSYSSDTAPTDAGSYTVTVTYPGGQTGSADFTVAPRPISSCGWNFKNSLTYNGLEQTQSVTVSYNGTKQVEGTDYTLSDNKQTNAGTYTMTITGTGNIEGTKTVDFTIKQKEPTVDDFNIPEIGEYAYTGNPVELPLPTLKEGYTGGGEITLSYTTGSTQPTEMGEHTVWFKMTEGDNFLSSSGLEYGTLVIKPAGFAVNVNIEDWTYGDTPKTPTYTDYEGEPTFLWTGTTRAGKAYSSDTAPTEAGSYTVTVTYPGGQTGSDDFTVHPRSISSCVVTLDNSELTYNGMEQTKGLTVHYAGAELVEGVDYTVTGNTGTNAGTYTVTVTGIGNLEGTKTASFTISKKSPTADDFNIPEIAEYAYTGKPVELPLPTLKEGYTGGGEITLSYTTGSTQPTEMGEHTVWFEMTEGDNFHSCSYLEYGTLVIKPAGFAVIVNIEDWTYGDATSTLTYTDYEGEPTILWTGTTRAGKAYSSDTAPTEAGSYTVTVTYPGGQTGSADFTVHPQSINYCAVWLDDSELTYNGLEQTKGVNVSFSGITQVEGVDYTVTGNKQTNAGTHTITVTGIGNVEGTKTVNFTIYEKHPTVDDFNIPEIAEYAYTGKKVELPLPTLKEPYTGGGTITVYYNGVSTQPTKMGEYEVTFRMGDGTNFYSSSYFEYGTLVIKAADISDIVLHDLDVPQVGKTPDTSVYSGYSALYTALDVCWLDEEDAEVNSFEEGKFYTVEITVSSNYIGDGSGNRFNFADSVTASINGNAVSGEGNSVTVNDDHKVTIRYKFAAAPAGAIVSGTVTSFNSDTDDVTIELFAEGSTSADYIDTVKGNTAEYSIVGVAEGTYTMRVSKANHVTREYTIVVGTDDVTQDVELNLYADTNLDGEIDVEDYQALVNAVLKDDHEQIGTAEYDDLIHYDLVMDGYLDVLDVAVMELVVNGHRTINEVYDIKKGDYDYDGEAFTESDIVAMQTALSDIETNAPKMNTAQKFAADVNYNGKVDSDDLAFLIKRYGNLIV